MDTTSLRTTVALWAPMRIIDAGVVVTEMEGCNRFCKYICRVSKAARPVVQTTNQSEGELEDSPCGTSCISSCSLALNVQFLINLVVNGN